MGNNPTVVTDSETPLSISRPPAGIGPGRVDRDSVCAADGNRLGRPTPGNGVWLRYDLLATVTGLAESGGMGPNPSRSLEPASPGRPDRFFPCGGRFCLGPGGFWGAKTGPNPTDRRKKGSKHHVIADARGIPLAVKLTGANRHDVTQLLPLVEAIPPMAGKIGRPRQRPDQVQGDRGYDSEPHRQALRRKQIEPVLAKRRTGHGSGLGIFRWVIERTLAWLHQNRRLRVRYERRADIHEAFLILGCIKICWNHLANSSFC